MTLPQAKTYFIKHCVGISCLGINHISNYLNSCKDEDFDVNIFAALMKNEGIKVCTTC